MKTLFHIATLLLALSAMGQQNIEAIFCDETIKVDGILDESIWQQATHATDFTSVFPKPNQKPSEPTIYQIVYDKEALYLGAYLREKSRDSIMNVFTLRDQLSNTDFTGVIFDTYGNGNLGFEFFVTPSGVQFDAKVTPDNEDNSWDAIWESATTVTDTGWYLEIKLPYAAIRFPKADEQKWNINFLRRRFVSGESSWWQNIDFEQNNPILNQMGSVNGIQNIEPPKRIMMTPYATVYGLKSKDPNRDPEVSLGTSYNFGMDLKLGLSDAFTMDMTLIPDFGQVRSDNVVLNLSPFEVRFNDNRAFFTEGLEMFEKAGIFYSRRVGDNQQLYNATKVSGRNKNGLGIGIFNAVAKEESQMVFSSEIGQEIKQIDKPLTNYNVLVFDKDLKNNSSISLTNTNVLREGTSFRDANVTVGTFNLKNKEQTFGVEGRVGLSVNSVLNDQKFGHDARIRLGKINGPWVYNLTYEERSQDYSHNDLGFQNLENYRGLYFNLNKRDFDGFWKFNQFNYWINLRYLRNIQPSRYTDASANIGIWAQTAKFFSFNLWGGGALAKNDFYEPRVWGEFVEIPATVYGGYWFSTDYRKKLVVQSYGNIYKYLSEDRWVERLVGGNIQFRFSDKFNLSFDSFLQKKFGNKGFVNNQDDEIIFGQRNVKTISSVLNLNYIFNNKIGFTLGTRHYWSSVNYRSYEALDNLGSLRSSAYNAFHDLSFNAFTIDAILNWRFAPGSDIRIVWKNNLSGIYNDMGIDYSTMNYIDGVGQLKALPQNNSLSIRVSYFLDYASQIRPMFN